MQTITHNIIFLYLNFHSTKSSFNFVKSRINLLKQGINLLKPSFKSLKTKIRIPFSRNPYSILLPDFDYSFGNKAILNSSSCESAISEGLSIIISLALLFLGKAMKSLIVSTPANIEHILSNPNAIPP